MMYSTSEFSLQQAAFGGEWCPCSQSVQAAIRSVGVKMQGCTCSQFQVEVKQVEVYVYLAFTFMYCQTDKSARI